MDHTRKLDFLRTLGAARVADHTTDDIYVLIGPDPFGTQGRRESMDRFHALLEGGTLDPVVDWTFTLDQVPDALTLLASGQALSRIVIVP